MTIKAKLKIQLLANEVIVAESEDSIMWNRILGMIQGASFPSDNLETEDTSSDTSNDQSKEDLNGLGSLAKALDVTIAELEGACGPSLESPFLHLESVNWEHFKKITPSRGHQAVSPVQLAGTLLCLWFKYGKLEGIPTQRHVRAVLGKLGVDDKNPSRGIKNSSWLQNRNGGIQINPAQISKSIEVARSFILINK